MAQFKYLIQCELRAEFNRECRRLQIPPSRALWSERPYELRGLALESVEGLRVHSVPGYVPTANCREIRSQLQLMGWVAP